MTNPADLRRDDETLDAFYHGRIQILQKKKGYRFSVDAPLLADFIRPRADDEALDIGTGSGIISLLLSGKPLKKITALEIQPGLADLARRNVELNIPYPIFSDPLGRNGLPESLQTAVVNVGGRPRQVVLAGTPVYAGDVVTKDGQPLTGDDTQRAIALRDGVSATTTTGEIVGYTFQYVPPTGGDPFVVYGVKDPTGVLVFTTENPFTDRVQATSQGDLVYIGEPFNSTKANAVGSAWSEALNIAQQNAIAAIVAPNVSPADLARFAESGMALDADNLLTEAQSRFKAIDEAAKARRQFALSRVGEATVYTGNKGDRSYDAIEELRMSSGYGPTGFNQPSIKLPLLTNPGQTGAAAGLGVGTAVPRIEVPSIQTGAAVGAATGLITPQTPNVLTGATAGLSTGLVAPKVPSVIAGATAGLVGLDPLLPKTGTGQSGSTTC